MATREILIHNSKKVVIKHVLVSEEDYEWVNQYSWHLKTDNNTKNDGTVTERCYAYRDLKKQKDTPKKSIGMHVEICKKIHGEIPDGMIVDHIDRNTLNNTRTNLRIASMSDNSQNTPTRTLGYRGVQPRDGKFYVRASDPVSKNKVSLGTFEDEIKAAIVHDTFVLVTRGPGAKTNGLVNYDDVKHLTREDVLPKRETREFPSNIYMKGNKYMTEMVIQGKKYKEIFDTLEEAKEQVKIYEEMKENIRQEAEDAHMAREITRNEDGIAIVPISNRDEHILVDDDKWHDLMTHPWRVCGQGKSYQSEVNGKTIVMHRYIIFGDKDDEEKDKKIFHINKNNKDNRVANLAITPNHSDTCQGRTGPAVKPVNSDIEYKGVHRRTDNPNRYTAKVGPYNCGSYDCTMKAALAVNIKAKEVHGDNATLHELPEDFVRDNIENVKKTMIEGPDKTSKYNGVSYKSTEKGKKKWKGSFQYRDDKLDKLFLKEIEAAAAYNIYVMKYPELAHKLNPDIPQEVIDEVKAMLETPRELTSKYKYVSWHKKGNSFRYTLPPGAFANDKKIPLSKSGFKTDKEAAIAVNQVVRDIKGDQTITVNVIDE